MKKRIVFEVILIIIVLLIVTIISIIYLKYINDRLDQNTLKNLKELTKQDGIKIEQALEEHIRILKTIVNEVKALNVIDENEIFNIYTKNAGKEKFSRIGIMQKDGKVVTNDQKIVDLSEEIEYFFGTDEVQISKSKQSRVDQEEINIYSKKITVQSQDIVILIVLETDKFREMFTQDVYEGEGYEYIITNDGTIIANSNSLAQKLNIEITNQGNIFEIIRKKNLIKNVNEQNRIEQIESDIKNGKEGYNKITINGKNYYLAYIKLAIENWNLVIITPGNIIARDINISLRVIFVVCLIIIIITFIITTYIIVANRKKKEKLYRLAYIDPVTNLGNYNYFLEKGKEMLKEVPQNNKYILVLDIDKFKTINKKYGHEIGNLILKELSNILIKQIQNKKIICRFSADIFGIFLETADNIEDIVKNINSKISKIRIKDRQYILLITIGIYKIKKDDTEIKDVLDKAIIAKNAGKGKYQKQYYIFDEKLENKLTEEHNIESIMEEAIQKSEFKVYYQPKISLKDKTVIGAEALVRWERKGEFIFPDKFIPVFEKNQFIIKLDIYIFEEVCKNLVEWQKKYGNIPKISVNISKEHFEYKNFIEEYVNILNKYNLKPEMLEIEITESVAVEKENIVETIKKIKKEGFIISLDDFGTGYSSLNMLENIGVDIIKIDKSFIDNIEQNEKKQTILKYIIMLIKKIGLKIVAEGVENAKQIKYLEEWDCDFIQGYFYSKPLTKKEFEKYFYKN